jgi:hypothetical protein
MRKLSLTLTAVLAAAALAVPAALAAITTTFNPAAAPTGTHVQSGTPSCSVDPNTLLVSCSSYNLAGVGNSDATATLSAGYTATVQCRNHGGQIVEVKSQAESAPTSTGQISPKNGQLTVPSLNSGPVPTASDFEAMATCPNGNWTKSLESGTVTLSNFTYTVTFARQSGAYITITGP